MQIGLVGLCAIAVCLGRPFAGWPQQQSNQSPSSVQPEAASQNPRPGQMEANQESDSSQTPEAPSVEAPSVSPAAKVSQTPASPSESPKADSSERSNRPSREQMHSSPQSPSARYLLRYKFQPGEIIRWEVTHQALIRTTVSGVSQTAESVSRSVKRWKVLQVQPDGTAVFEHMVENVQMWQKLTGRQEVRYDSQTDKEPPPGFQTIAKSIGVPLAKITLSPEGKVVHRQRYISQPQDQPDSPITMPLPAEPMAVGQSWSEVFELEVPLETGAVRKVRTKQIFILKDVQNNVATIEAATQILTPNLPPEVEAKIIQQASAGFIRFDLEQGRVVEQQIEVDKRVIGFRGEASSLHCLSRFQEKLLSSEQTARRP